MTHFDHGWQLENAGTDCRKDRQTAWSLRLPRK